MTPIVNIFWFRRDLRIRDNAGLYHALKGEHPVLPVFIFDRHILDELDDPADRRVEFIYAALKEIQQQLEKLGSTLDVRYGFPEQIIDELVKEYRVAGVYTNHDYEPYAVQRDKAVSGRLATMGIGFHTFKDQVILEKNEVLKEDGTPYTVFTPYSRRWKATLNHFQLKSYPTDRYSKNFLSRTPKEFPSLAQLKFKAVQQPFPSKKWKEEVIENYDKTRDIPSLVGTSRLSVHLRFGTVSIREVARKAGALNATFLNELIWRDFYHMILWHFPKVVGQAFRMEYDKIKWRNNELEFDLWCKGETGYPIVDAGMRELNTTGFMHNRVRMIVASFLTKHLLIDWRWGEAYFAKKLLDYDLAANNGGWQWAAGSGAPYFRVFNPYLQTKKFDPELKYIRQWVPEFEELAYPGPIVDHVFARNRCLQVYSAALKK